jgi:small-conductance mechanosensitive channel
LRRHIIPNSKFLKKNIKTYNAESLLKYEFDIIVDSSINVVAALPLIKQTINSFAFVISKEYTEVLLDSFTDKNVKIKIHFYFDPNNGYTVEVLKSAIQIELFTLIKSLSKKSEKKEEKKQTSSEEIQTITTPTVVGVVTH